MTNMAEHPISDEAISHLSTFEGVIGELVRAFHNAGITNSTDWIGTWFNSRSEAYFEGLAPSSVGIESLSPMLFGGGQAPLASGIKLKTLTAQYFRGFRAGLETLDLSSDLIVIEGRNSSGKTSLAEALEWLFTGALSRRESDGGGNPRELEDCITNQFRPSESETWVEAKFTLNSSVEGPTEIRLKRVLLGDYGATSNALCTSQLWIGGVALTKQEEQRILDQYFASVPPLLLQHTLHEFVQGAPRRRRDYFERLLRVDVLSEFIGKAVVSDDRAEEFTGPYGRGGFGPWKNLVQSTLNAESSKHLDQLRQDREPIDLEKVSQALLKVSCVEFLSLLGSQDNVDAIALDLKREQTRVLQNAFPLLTQLRPVRRIADGEGQTSLSLVLIPFAARIREAWLRYEPALREAEGIGKEKLAISRAYQILSDAGLVIHGLELQECPMCAYEPSMTLSKNRISIVEDWNHASSHEQAARAELQSEIVALRESIGSLLNQAADLLPNTPDESQWTEALEGKSSEVSAAVANLRVVNDGQRNLRIQLAKGRAWWTEPVPSPKTLDECEAFLTTCIEVIGVVSELPNAVKSYCEAFDCIESAVESLAGDDPRFRLRQLLIDCLENGDAIVEGLQWENAKRLAQTELQEVRAKLIEYRQMFLELRRKMFNEGMNSVWSVLRNERYSSFSQIQIPAPRGRGFQIEIEVKASLDDGVETKEVDALRVFSESQVNALGIAAFVTRSKLLGHKVLILDDPVQSMDEDHFKTFARDLVPHLLNEGFQIVVLTHNDSFARDMSHYHYDRDGYVSMEIQHSRRIGSVVMEGNRRVAERLALSERKLEEGDLRTAWTYIRLALERLYLIAYVKYGPSDFEADSWHRQTAEYMWESGAGEVITSTLPEAGMRLKEILDLTASGAHDSRPQGETEIRNTLSYLRSCLGGLRLGG